MIFNQVVAGGGTTPTGKYQLLDRVTDDSNNEIGTVCGFHTDSNNNEYAVVCLDAKFRLSGGNVISAQVEITGLPKLTKAIWDNKDTATENCDKILSFIAGTEYTSTGVSHCRSKNFIIDSTTYYGQLPNIIELNDVYRFRSEINSKDTSASQYSSLIIPNNTYCYSSSQQSTQHNWAMFDGAAVNYTIKNSNGGFIIPILELPNAIA